MKNDDSSRKSKPSKEELDALFKDMPLFDLKSVRNTLYKRSISLLLGSPHAPHFVLRDGVV